VIVILVLGDGVFGDRAFGAAVFGAVIEENRMTIPVRVMEMSFFVLQIPCMANRIGIIGCKRDFQCKWVRRGGMRNDEKEVRLLSRSQVCSSDSNTFYIE
jgi:hypothetical protein